MKTNIKSKKFYKEANDIQDGWGDYLKSIDELKDDVQYKRNIGLRDACWILGAEGHCFSVWEDFQKYCITNHWKKKQMPWEAWYGLFQLFIKENPVL